MAKDITYYRHLPYSILLRQDKDTNGVYWIAEVREWQGCSTRANTKLRALSDLEDAIDAWLEWCIEHGRLIPEPEWSA